MSTDPASFDTSRRGFAGSLIGLFVTCFLLLLTHALGVGEASVQASDLGQQLEGYLERVAQERGLNAAVIVVWGNEVVFRQGYGFADDATKVAFTPDTVVGLASVSKQFTAAAILRLVDLGKVSVDSTLGELLPSVPTDKAEITLQQLLTHTSGLLSDYMKDDLEPLTQQEALGRIFASKLQSHPGDRFLYANAGYTLLAAVIDYRGRLRSRPRRLFTP